MIDKMKFAMTVRSWGWLGIIFFSFLSLLGMSAKPQKVDPLTNLSEGKLYSSKDMYDLISQAGYRPVPFGENLNIGDVIIEAGSRRSSKVKKLENIFDRSGIDKEKYIQKERTSLKKFSFIVALSEVDDDKLKLTCQEPIVKKINFEAIQKDKKIGKGLAMLIKEEKRISSKELKPSIIGEILGCSFLIEPFFLGEIYRERNNIGYKSFRVLP